jgi:hypothetical protein
MTTVKKPRAPRKPKATPIVEVTTAAEVTPVKKPRKPRAPRKPKVTTVAAPIVDETGTAESASIDKFISELHRENQAKFAKENSFFKKNQQLIYETLVAIVIFASAYLVGHYINSDRVEPPKEHVTF